MGKKVLCAMLLVLAVTGTAQADLIDFEGFAPLTPLGSVPTASNIVTFSVGTPGGGDAFVAEVGNPQTAFVPNDTPAAATAGERFLTDETAGPSAKLDYFMEFDTPVLELSLDLYDYRYDGGPRIGDTATLTVFSDLFGTEVGSDIFTIPRERIEEGNVVALSILSPVASIMSASLVFSTGDVGTGIDNVEFTTAPVPTPEPATFFLLGSGLAGLLGFRRKFKKSG